MNLKSESIRKSIALYAMICIYSRKSFTADKFRVFLTTVLGVMIGTPIPGISGRAFSRLSHRPRSHNLGHPVDL